MLIHVDIIQDIFVKELRSYKPTPEKAGSEQGQVKELRAPPKPAAPVMSDKVDEELKLYDVQHIVEDVKEESMFEEEGEESSAKEH